MSLSEYIKENPGVIIQVKADDLKEFAEVLLSKENQNYPQKVENDDDGLEHLYTTEDAQQILNVSRPTLVLWKRNGKLVPKQIGRRNYYTWEAIKKAMK